jgi:hypothetical protein
MHKAISMMLLTVVSTGAAAEWVAVGSSGNSTTTIYADPATIRKSGNMVKMWSLVDYKTPQGGVPKPYMSIRSRDEYDCNDERARGLSLTRHAGNMARGETVFKDSHPEKWEPVPPNSVGEGLWKFACAKR